jgi:hypothetical protein
MVDAELLALLTGERQGVIHVCSIRADLARLVGATTTAVWLSDYTVRKQEIRHHHPDLVLYRLAPTIIREGFIRVQPKYHLVFIWHHETDKLRSYRATVKATRDGREMYLASVHRLDPTDVRATYRRTVSVRDHEERREVGPPGNPTLRSDDE